MFVGQRKTVCGPVVGTHYAESSEGGPTFLNIGLPYPEVERFTVVIWQGSRPYFSGAPELLYQGQTICVTGELEEYRGSIEVIATGERQIVIR